jgi:SRSO17 transposase
MRHVELTNTFLLSDLADQLTRSLPPWRLVDFVKLMSEKSQSYDFVNELAPWVEAEVAQYRKDFPPEEA